MDGTEREAAPILAPFSGGDNSRAAGERAVASQPRLTPPGVECEADLLPEAASLAFWQPTRPMPRPMVLSTEGCGRDGSRSEAGPLPFVSRRPPR